MKTTSTVAALIAAVILMGIDLSGAVSEPVLVNFSPHYDNGHWTTVFTNEVPLCWDWPATATSAKLSIAGMNESSIIDFTEVTSNWLWQAFSDDVPSVEDTYALTLTFYASNETVVEQRTSQLTVAKGAFGETPVDPGPSNTKWSKVRQNVLLPYDAGWMESTSGVAAGQLVIAKIDGAVQTNALADAGGYFGWKLRPSDWGYGTFALALTFPSKEGLWDATLTRFADGSLITVK